MCQRKKSPREPELSKCEAAQAREIKQRISSQNLENLDKAKVIADGWKLDPDT